MHEISSYILILGLVIEMYEAAKMEKETAALRARAAELEKEAAETAWSLRS